MQVGGDPTVWGIFSWEARVSVFILLGRTSEINSPKNKYVQEERCFLIVFW